MLDAQYVDNVTDLARWAKLASFDTCLMPMVADIVKIRDALARREISACGTETTASFYVFMFLCFLEKTDSIYGPDLESLEPIFQIQT